MKLPNKLKTCLQEYLDEGISESPEVSRWHKSIYKSIAMFLISDLKRLGFDRNKVKEMIRNWNEQRNDPPMPAKEADGHLYNLVDWVYDKFKYEFGCGKDGDLYKEGICFIDKRECPYFDEMIRLNNNPYRFFGKDYDDLGWGKYLSKEYKNGRLMGYVYKTIRKQCLIKNSRVAFIGFHRIANSILNETREYTKFHDMDIHRAVTNLINEGLIIKVETGKSGKNSQLSNGYEIVYPVPQLPKSWN